MSFTDQKITDAEIAAAGVQSQPNKLTGTPAQNKAVFDALVKNLIKIKLNALVDELLGGNAAAQIGVDTVTGLTAQNVQDALEEIMQNMQGISQGAVADGSITTAKLADGAVTEAKLGSGAVTESKLVSGAVTEGKLGSGAVSEGKIASGGVTTAKLADGAVTEAKLGSQAVTAGKIANAAVDNTKLAADAVTAVKINAGAVTHSKLAEGSVFGDKILESGISFSKIAGLTNVVADSTLTLSLAPNDRKFLVLVGTSAYGVFALSAAADGTKRVHNVNSSAITSNITALPSTDVTFTVTSGGAAYGVLVDLIPAV